MDLVRKIIREGFELAENIQQADKIYFKTGLLTPEDRERILSITGGDAFTRLVADWYYHLFKVWKNINYNESLPMLEQFYQNLKTYDKNVFPIEGSLESYNSQTDERGHHILDLYSQLKERSLVIRELRKLPATALRNLKDLIRTPNVSRNEYYFKEIFDKLKELNVFLNMLPKPNRNDSDELALKKEQRKNLFLNKIFASNNILDDMYKIAQQFAYAFNTTAEETDKEDVLDNIEGLDATVVQNTGDILVIKVESQEAMERIGCTAAWCFARPGAYDDWESYSDGLGYVYVIFDFKKDIYDATFLMTYLPNSMLYTSTNVPVDEIGIHNEVDYLHQIGVNTGHLYNDEAIHNKNNSRDDDDEIENDEDDNEKPQIISKPKVQTNPNQLSLFEVRKMIREMLLTETKKKSKFEKLKDNKIPLTDEERKEVMDADAVWHFSPGNKPTPAVWKSKNKKTGKITYVTNTHRAYQDRTTLKAAINIFHSFIKGTA